MDLVVAVPAPKNVRAGSPSITWAVDSGETQSGQRLAGLLNTFWASEGLAAEGLARSRAALAMLGATDPKNRAEALYATAGLAWYLCQYEANRTLALEALDLFGRSDDRRGTPKSFILLGLAAMSSGDVEAARRAFAASEERAVAIGDDVIRLYALADGGELSLRLGDLDDAERCLSEALDLARSTSTKTMVCYCLIFLARIDVARGDAGSARARLGEAERMLPLLGVDEQQHWCSLASAEAALLAGDPDAAGPLMPKPWSCGRGGETGSACGRKPKPRSSPGKEACTRAEQEDPEPHRTIWGDLAR